jgi:hypothetical protein
MSLKGILLRRKSEIPEEEIKRISKVIEERIASGNYEPKNSSYKPVVLEDILNKKGLREHSEEEDFECPELEETIDVATLPLARSTTVLSENGKKRVITMGDPVVQYLSSLPKGENPKTFYMKESSLALKINLSTCKQCVPRRGPARQRLANCFNV